MAVTIAALIPLLIAALAAMALLKVGAMNSVTLPLVVAMPVVAVLGVSISESVVDTIREDATATPTPTAHPLNSWDNRRAITVDNTSGSAKSDYPVKVELTSSNFDFAGAQANGEDIRITDSDGETVLDYWIQDFNSASSTATIWAKVPSIPGSDSAIIYMYYNNSSASDGQDADNTFTVFDDFSGSGPIGDISDQSTVKLRLGQVGGIGGNPIASSGDSGWRQSQVREPSNVVWDGVNSRWYILVSGRDGGLDGAATKYTASTLEGSWTEDPSAPTIPETVVSAGEDGVENFHIVKDASGDISSAGDWWAWCEVVDTSVIYAFKSTDQGDSWSIQNSGNSVLAAGMNTTLNGAASSSDTVITVDDASKTYANDRINVDGEWRYVQSVSGNDITLVSALDSNHADGAAVKSFDAGFVASPAVTLFNGTLYMVYEGAEDPDTGDYIAHAGLATSTDGITWTKQGAIIAPTMSANDSNRYQIVFDSAKKVGSTWYATSHDKGDVDGVTDWRTHIYSTTDDPDAWDRNSWSLLGTNPIDEKIGIAKLVDIAGDNDTGVEGSYIVIPNDGNSEINLARFIANSAWTPAWVINTEQSEDSIDSADIYINSSDELVLSSILRGSASDDRYHTQLRQTTSPALTNDFAIRFRSKQSGWHRGMAFGSGGPVTVELTLDNSQQPALDDGYYVYFRDFSAETDNVKLNEISSGSATNHDSGDVASADMQALTIYEFRYTDNGGVGTLELVDDSGTVIVTVNDTTHLSSSKNIAIGQGDANDVSQPGGDHTLDWLAVRPFDGADPSQTVGSEESGPWD